MQSQLQPSISTLIPYIESRCTEFGTASCSFYQNAAELLIYYENDQNITLELFSYSTPKTEILTFPSDTPHFLKNTFIFYGSEQKSVILSLGCESISLTRTHISANMKKRDTYQYLGELHFPTI